jgi:nicotinate phosphoribosyltransferase
VLCVRLTKKIPDIELLDRWCETCLETPHPMLFRDIQNRGLSTVIDKLPTNVGEAKIQVRFRLKVLASNIELINRKRKERELLEINKKNVFSINAEIFFQQFSFPFKYDVGEKEVLSGLSENSWGDGRRKNTVIHLLLEEDWTDGRYSKKWQEYVNVVLSSYLSPKQFLGTSNVNLAFQYNIPIFGTFAHELPMVNAGIIGAEALLAESQNFAFDKCFLMYGEKLAMCLPDTFTSEHTFKTFGQIRARNWRGFRQDSGDPFVFGRRLLDKYQEWGVDAKTKTLMFSDDLNLTKMYELEKEFGSKIKVVFGWGTNLTNDTNLQPLSIVMKAVKANGTPLVKLSDDPIKHTGEDATIAVYKRIFYD